MGPNCLYLRNIPGDSYEHKFENYYCKCKAFKKAILYIVLTTLVIWYYQAIAEQKQQIKNAKISPFIHEWYQGVSSLPMYDHKNGIPQKKEIYFSFL